MRLMDSGINEHDEHFQRWIFFRFGFVRSYWHEIMHADQSEVKLRVTMRQERAQMLVSNFSKLTGMVRNNADDLITLEAVTQLKRACKWVVNNKNNFDKLCDGILKAKPLFQKLVKTEDQIDNLDLLMIHTKEQIDYENSI